MYNSRPRYNRYSRDFSVPENYSGNAFRENDVPSVTETVEEVSDEKKYDSAQVGEKTVQESESQEVLVGHSERRESKKRLFPQTGFSFDVGKIFRGGIGFEELLIIGLILLISQNDNSDDIIILLALLLFIQ